MNVLFYTVMLLCTAIMLVTSPQTFLSTLLGAASKSATLCISLLATYSVWLGLMQVWQACGLSQKLSRLLRPISKRFFHVDDTQTLDAITMNLSVNVLGSTTEESFEQALKTLFSSLVICALITTTSIEEESIFT